MAALETLSGIDRQRLYQAAEMLLEARRTLQPIDDLPLALRPKTLEEAYFVQDLMLQALGKAGGWKVGAPPRMQRRSMPQCPGRLCPERRPDCEAIPQDAGRGSGDRLSDGEGSASARCSVLAGGSGGCHCQLPSGDRIARIGTAATRIPRTGSRRLRICSPMADSLPGRP